MDDAERDVLMAEVANVVRALPPEVELPYITTAYRATALVT
jgi:hypothetical protein